MLYAGLHSLSVNYKSFTVTNPLNRSTTVSEKLVFRVGKKALANRQALLQFLVERWLVRIAIVLGCVCGLILVFFIKRNNILKMIF